MEIKNKLNPGAFSCHRLLRPIANKGGSNTDEAFLSPLAVVRVQVGLAVGRFQKMCVRAASGQVPSRASHAPVGPINLNAE